MSDITVTFKNETILTMDASGSKDLLTQGKYCEDDISISYVKPSSGEDDTLTKKLNNTLTSYENSDLTSIPQGGLNFMGAAFKTLSLPNVTSAGQDAFRNNYITSFNLPKLQSSGQSLFYQSFSIEKIVLPAWVGMTANIQNVFAYCSELLAVDLGPNQIGTLGNFTFYNSAKFNTLILRSSSQIGLSNINAFNSTPFASGSAGGTLYVPQALIADYQAATNWSTILGYANNQILPIEGSIYENTYADGTPIT